MTERAVVGWAEISFGSGPSWIIVHEGSYSVTGQDVALEGASNWAIVAWAEISFGAGDQEQSIAVDFGSYIVSGQDVELVYDGAEEEEQQQPGGGRPAYRPEYFGTAYGVLPNLFGSARGGVGAVGNAVAILPPFTGSAEVQNGPSVVVVAEIAFTGRGGGDIGSAGRGAIVIQFKAKGSAAQGEQGNANAQLSIKGCANGRNDADDMAAIVATLAA